MVSLSPSFHYKTCYSCSASRLGRSERVSAAFILFLFCSCALCVQRVDETFLPHPLRLFLQLMLLWQPCLAHLACLSFASVLNKTTCFVRFPPELLTSCTMRMTPHFSVCVCVNVLLLMSLVCIFVVVGRFSLSSLRVVLLVSFHFPTHESGALFPFPSLQERKGAGHTHTHTHTREEGEIDPLLRKRTRIPSHLCAWCARRHEASTQVTGTLSFFVVPSQ